MSNGIERIVSDKGNKLGLAFPSLDDVPELNDCYNRNGDPDYRWDDGIPVARWSKKDRKEDNFYCESWDEHSSPL